MPSQLYTLQYVSLKYKVIFLYNHNVIITPTKINKVISWYQLIYPGSLK